MEGSLFYLSDVSAACVPKDMNGTWAVQALTSVMGNQLLSCKLIITSEKGVGSVDPRTNCLLKYNQSAQVKAVLGGKVEVSKDCSFEVTIDVDPAGYIIMEGDLARNKQTANARFNTNQLPENIQNNGYANYWGIASLVKK